MSKYAGWIAWGAAALLLLIYGCTELARMYGLGIGDLGSLGPIATAITAAVALAIGLSTIRQKNASDAATIQQKTITDQREQWWKRVQWAADKSVGDDAAREIGQAALFVLQGDGNREPADSALLDALVEAQIARLAGLAEGGDIDFVVDDEG